LSKDLKNPKNPNNTLNTATEGATVTPYTDEMDAIAVQEKKDFHEEEEIAADNSNDVQD
jgi:hypothetical protein